MRYLLAELRERERQVLMNEIPPPARPIDKPPLRLRELAYFDDVTELLCEIGDMPATSQGSQVLKAVMLACDRLAWIQAARGIGGNHAD